MRLLPQFQVQWQDHRRRAFIVFLLDHESICQGRLKGCENKCIGLEGSQVWHIAYDGCQLCAMPNICIDQQWAATLRPKFGELVHALDVIVRSCGQFDIYNSGARL